MFFTKDLNTHPLKPCGLTNRCLYCFGRVIVYSFFKAFCRYRREGPPMPDGPVIVAANHESFLDPPLLQLMVGRRRLHFMMTESFYYMRTLNRFCNAMRCVAVKQDGLNKTSINLALEVLNAGKPVAIFPQGARMAPDDLSSASKGVAFLARRSKVPVVPVRLRGAGRALPRGAWLPRPHRVSAHMGEPIDFSLPKGETINLEGIKDRIMDAIAAL